MVLIIIIIIIHHILPFCVFSAQPALGVGPIYAKADWPIPHPRARPYGLAREEAL